MAGPDDERRHQDFVDVEREAERGNGADQPLQGSETRCGHACAKVYLAGGTRYASSLREVPPHVRGRTEIQHHPRAGRRQQEADIQHRVRRHLRRMNHHRRQHVHERRAAEHERHDEERRSAIAKRIGDADRAKGAERPGQGGGHGARHVEVAQLTLRRQRRDRHEHGNQEVGDAHAQHGLHRVAKPDLAAMQRRPIQSPRQSGAKRQRNPRHTRFPSVISVAFKR